jgi:CspA family cold shock protein
MAEGTIRRLVGDRGFGFIADGDGHQYFFHASAVRGVEFDALREGQRVEFTMGRAADGRERASNVRLRTD